MSTTSLVEGIFEGNKAILARAITLLESSKPEHFEKANAIIEKCLAKPTKSIRIGITGVPGVGKSSFIEVFGKTLTNLGKKVAVLAVDPTSTLSKGSILGDKTKCFYSALTFWRIFGWCCQKNTGKYYFL